MAAQNTELDEIQRVLTPFFKRTSAIKAMVFGSVARGSQTKRSDLDLAIIVETDARFFDRYETYAPIQNLIPNRSVEILIYTPSELEKISHRPFIKQILDEGKTIYES